MKKLIFILFLALVSLATKANSVAAPTDTLSYLQTIVANKSQYIGQPFSKLLNDLQIQIKTFSPFGGIHYDMNKETSTSFSFYESLTKDDYYLSYPRLNIIWQTPLNRVQSDSLGENNAYKWSSTISTYYSTNTVKEIYILQ